MRTPAEKTRHPPCTPRAERRAEVFRAEQREFLDRLPGVFGSAHGDRVVAVALANPSAQTASPLTVLETIVLLKLQPGELWTKFKEAGGVSKELGNVHESEQLEALRELWTRLHEP